LGYGPQDDLNWCNAKEAYIRDLQQGIVPTWAYNWEDNKPDRK